MTHKDFARDWIDAWNSHNLDAIMEHYDENIEFWSPVMVQMNINKDGVIRDKALLRDYFGKALEKYPDLRFNLHHCLEGISSLVLFYTSINDRYAAEYMRLNDQGKIVEVRAHYTG